MRSSFAVWVAILLLSPALTFGLSFSSAPGYGAAAHLDDPAYLSEWFGQDGSVADGITYPPSFWLGETANLSGQISLNYFFDGGSYEWASIWIDWNQDKVFDNSELVYDINDVWFDNGTTSFATSFEVPTWAALGDTWMRARITYDGPLTPTGDYFTGEVEDYQVNVSSQGDVVPEPTTLILLGLGMVGVAGYTRRRFM